MFASSSRLGLRVVSPARQISPGSVLVRPATLRRDLTRSAVPGPKALLSTSQAAIPRLGRTRNYASASGPASTTDPALTRALETMDDATQSLENGDLEGAKAKYEESLGIQETSAAWFNLGVCEYHLKNTQSAITAWEKSIILSPSSDAHTNLASAYILSQPPQAALAIKHLTAALELSPDDPEIAFNLAAVLESTDNLDTALTLYQRAEKGGIERASQNIRNVSAKILAKRAEATSSTPPPTGP